MHPTSQFLSRATHFVGILKSIYFCVFPLVVNKQSNIFLQHNKWVCITIIGSGSTYAFGGPVEHVIQQQSSVFQHI